MGFHKINVICLFTSSWGLLDIMNEQIAGFRKSLKNQIAGVWNSFQISI